MMTDVTWIVERDIFSQRNFNDIVGYLAEEDIPFRLVRVTPFSHEIEGKLPKINTKHVVAYGSVGVDSLSKKYGWNPGVFFDPLMFNYETYLEYVGDFMLNNDAEIVRFASADKVMDFDVPYFIRPVADDKKFAGLTMRSQDYQLWKENLISIGYLDDFDFNVVVAPYKEILSEWRVVVVDGKVVASSLYRENGRQRMEQEILPSGAKLLVQTLAEEFSPAEVYVVDVAETRECFKIIEYNCFNSAGLYACDVGKIISAINNFLERK